MKAIGYVRVSTEEQALNGVSLDAQEDKIKAYCIAKEWDLIRVIRDEGYSAKDLNRPGIQEVISGCKKKEFDVVTTLNLSRLSRSVKNVGYIVEDIFQKNNIAFCSLQDNFDTATANGRMIMNILATLGQAERDKASQTTREVMSWMRGKRLAGAVPFGYDACANRSLLPNTDEAAIVQKMLSLRKRGKSYHSIAVHLNSKGIPAKQGGRWYAKTVRGVLLYNQTVLGLQPAAGCKSLRAVRETAL